LLSRVEQFERIRKDRALEGLSIHALAKRHGVHRRAVRQALDSATPPPKRSPQSRPAPSIGPFKAIIDQWLIDDQDAPPKQRHTAQRIAQRIEAEFGTAIPERTVRHHVHKRRRELSLKTDGFVPQAHPPGLEAQVDWGEADALIGGELTRVHFFLMRASHSGATFARAYERETQQAFLEAHALAFEYFGGVFAEIKYDNLKAAVTKILRGRRRIESDRFTAMRSHYLFESVFTTPGKRGAHEKGGVEGEVGRFRRSHLVPVPKVASIAALNQMLDEATTADLARTPAGKSAPVGALLAKERSQLAPLPDVSFDASEHSRVRVNQKSLVTVRQNYYSVPAGLIGTLVDARIHADRIEVMRAGSVVAAHQRLLGRYQTAAKLDHYADLLRCKPGAFRGALALAQDRERGAWPACFDELWSLIEQRYGRSAAAAQMVDVLLLIREHGPHSVAAAATSCVSAGAYDSGAVALLARRAGPREAPPLAGLDAKLAGVGHPPPSLDQYNDLLVGAR
jgi:transposase